MSILKSLKCPQCQKVHTDQLTEEGVQNLCDCGGELLTFYGDYRLGTGKLYRPTLARTGPRVPKIGRDNKPIGE